jgi:hypothetical protein
MAGYINGGGGGGGTADLTPHTQDFNNVNSITVSHSLGYYPAVWIVLSTGVYIDASITYGSGTFTIDLSTNLSGTVYYR